MLNCYIVDDEQQAIDGLIAMMQVKFPERVRIIGSTTDARKAIHEIDQLKPDLLFLDVEMPMINGLELLKHFPERKFQVNILVYPDIIVKVSIATPVFQLDIDF